MFRKMEERNIAVKGGESLMFGSGEYSIDCVKGTLWITWPGSDDIILNQGDSLFSRIKGGLSIMAFSDSYVVIRIKRAPFSVRDIPLAAIRFIAGVLVSCVRERGDHSVFGDSVHTISR